MEREVTYKEGLKSGVGSEMTELFLEILALFKKRVFPAHSFSSCIM